MNKQISILGCGWLGFDLAKSFIKNGFSVNGSTTTPGKILAFENANIKPFIISIGATNIIGDMNPFLANSTILIIDIPPQLRNGGSDNFVSKIERIIPFIENSTIEKVIFISSTSVYNDNECTSSKQYIVDEKSIFEPETESGKQLLTAEKLLLSNKNFQTSIIRFGGLIGDYRHPIKHLAGRENIQNPEAPINLIHKNDCIGMIEKITEIDIWNEIFNGVHPNHPSRKEYYTQKATQMKLDAPKFETNQTSFGKLVSSEKSQKILGYVFENDIY